jgi:hypothetical protein
MARKRAPSARKAQELAQWLDGQSEARHGEELFSPLIRLSTERVLQEALEREQAAELGRERYERREAGRGDRHD